MKVRIVAIGKKDAWYSDRKFIIGEVGTLESSWTANGGFRAGDFIPDNPIHFYNDDFTCEYFCFYRVKVHQIK